MKLLKTFNEENASKFDISKMRVRRAVRAIILDKDSKITILSMGNGEYYSLPGGGVGKEETLEEGVIRECKEETGCDVEIVRVIGQIDEIRAINERINRTICFETRVIGEKGSLQLDDEEVNEGLKLMWVNTDEAAQLLADFKHDIPLYPRYTRERDVYFFKTYTKS